MNEYKLFTQRIGLIGTTYLLINLCSFILLPILTKNISIEEYGIWIQIGITNSLIPSIVMLGLPYSMVRFLAATTNENENIQETFYSIAFTVAAASAIASFIIFSLSRPIAAILFYNNQTIVKILSFIVFMECMNGFCINYFRAFQQIKRYSVLLLMRTFLSAISVSGLVLFGYGIFGATIGLLASDIYIFIIMVILIIKEIGIQFPSFRYIFEYILFGFPTIPSTLSSWIVDSSDRYLIGVFLGTMFVGYYSPGYALGNIISIFVVPFGFLLTATLSEYFDNNKIYNLKIILTYSIKYFLMLAIPSAFGLSILSRKLLTILTTPEIALNGYLITPFAAASTVVFGAYIIISHIPVLIKKTKVTGAIWMIAALINLLLNMIAIPRIGILGAAITTLIAITLAFALTTYYSFRYIKFHIDFLFILKSIFASTIMSLIMLKWNPEGALETIIAVAICAIFYSACLLLLMSFDKGEIKLFLGIIQDLIH